MKQTGQSKEKNDETGETGGMLVDPELIVICKHCGKQIDQADLIGLSLLCPLCNKPQNGHPLNPEQDPYSDMMVICKHCGKSIDQVLLRGISLICPLCDKPQNGLPHPK